MKFDLRSLITRWTILGSLGVAGVLLVITLIVIGWTTPRVSPEVGFAPADLTIIPAPTGTLNVTAVPTTDPALLSPTAAGDQISINGYVQITGTEGEGLRVHATPGLETDTVFRGEEAEVFIVREGPQEVDGYTWWYIEAPYDETRRGWAAADFLIVVPPP